MAGKKSVVFELECPCCEAKLKIDPEVRAVLSYIAKEKPRTLEDISAGVAKLKKAEAEREEAFQKSFSAMKSQKEVLARKFDELLKKAKENPDEPPPKPLGLE
jgi:predicted nucleotide-binding protein (sugar kinase/HSP70/actin superfamily)